jgi:nucleoside-diphosphate-sugar epimerase
MQGSHIIAGGNGLIGRALTAKLVDEGVHVVVLGTSSNPSPALARFVQQGLVTYKSSNGDQNSLNKLEVELKQGGLFKEGSVFYDLSWRGMVNLRDGTLSTQLKNVGRACRYVRLAKSLGCVKFILTGSMEELALERAISTDEWVNKNDVARPPNNYALAKSAAKMQVSFEAYQQKIDFCYTRLSVVIDPELTTNKFVENALRQIVYLRSVPKPTNNELVSLIDNSSIAEQLIAVAQRGANTKTYVLGNGDSMRLAEYLRIFYELRFGDKCDSSLDENVHEGCESPSYLMKEDFSVASLRTDTGYARFESTSQLLSRVGRNL